MGAQSRSRHAPATSPEERLQHRVRSLEGDAALGGRLIFWGKVHTSTGFVIGGSGLTFTNLGTGNARVSWASGIMPNPPIVLLTPDTVFGGIIPNTSNVTATQFEVVTYDVAGTVVNGNVHFAVIRA